MAEDELHLEIGKEHWGKGVVRGLQPLLRELGDKHGNLVIVLQQSKGEIMLKGSSESIEAAKPELATLIEEHFPDAPMPAALLGEGAGGQDEDCCMAEEPPEEEVAPEPAVAKPAPTPPVASAAPAVAAAPAAKPAAAAQQTAPSGAPVKAKISLTSSRPVQAKAPIVLPPAKPGVVGRKQPTSSAHAPPDLLWQCMKTKSCFIKRPMKELPRFSSEPCNLMGLHSQRFSGLASTQALDIKPVKNGIKESIELVQSAAKGSKQRKPSARMQKTGLHKCVKRGLLQLDMELGVKFYRPDLHALAKEKYVKVQKSFRKKKPLVKSQKLKRSSA